MQDFVHMLVKSHRAFINHLLWIGSMSASKAILLKVISNSTRSFTGLTVDELNRNKDKMNFGIVEKVCRDRVIDSLKNDDERALKAFLLFERHLIKASLKNPSRLTPLTDRHWKPECRRFEKPSLVCKLKEVDL